MFYILILITKSIQKGLVGNVKDTLLKHQQHTRMSWIFEKTCWDASLIFDLWKIGVCEAHQRMTGRKNLEFFYILVHFWALAAYLTNKNKKLCIEIVFYLMFGASLAFPNMLSITNKRQKSLNDFIHNLELIQEFKTYFLVVVFDFTECIMLSSNAKNQYKHNMYLHSRYKIIC